jgi:hypothetical protein
VNHYTSEFKNDKAIASIPQTSVRRRGYLSAGIILLLHSKKKMSGSKVANCMLCEALEAKKRKWFRCCHLSGVNGKKKKRRKKKFVGEESKSTRRFVCVHEGENSTEIGLTRGRRAPEK